MMHYGVASSSFVYGIPAMGDELWCCFFIFEYRILKWASPRELEEN
jgi:hypothetical protein